jgi:hypothetical protein
MRDVVSSWATFCGGSVASRAINGINVPMCRSRSRWANWYVVMLARVPSGNRVLLAAGLGSILLGALGATTGRSAGLSGAFVAIGATLAVVSAFAPRSQARRLVIKPAEPVLVIQERPASVVHRSPSRGKLISGASLVMLLVFMTFLLAVLFVTLCVVTFVVLSGH